MEFKNSASMIAYGEDIIAATAAIVAPHCPVELDAFALELCNVGQRTPDEAADFIEGKTVPGDFRHYRIYDLADDMLILESIAFFLDPVEFGEIVINVLVLAKMSDATPQGPGTWVETVALPVVDPGVLELGVRFIPLD